MKKELKKRIITSIILVAILLNCLFINNISWLFLLIIVSLICWFEFIYLVKKIWKKEIKKILHIVLSFLFLCLYSAYIPKIHGSESLILFILGVCIFSDIGGYVVGKSVGGKKLTKISPNKTISGSIGSFLFSLFPVGLIIFSEHKIKQLGKQKGIDSISCSTNHTTAQWHWFLSGNAGACPLPAGHIFSSLSLGRVGWQGGVASPPSRAAWTAAPRVQSRSP